MKTLTDRMKEVMEWYHLNASETAEMIGISDSDLSDILEKGLGMRVDDFNRFCDTFKVNPDWLEYGVGSMRLGYNAVPASAEEVEFAKLVQTTYENNTMLKEILEYIHKVDNDEYINKEQVHEFVSNVVANLLTEMLLQRKGRGNVDKEFIYDIINKMK